MAYKAGNEQSVHQYSISKDEPLFLRARANAANLSEVQREGVGSRRLCFPVWTPGQQTPPAMLVSAEVTHMWLL